MVRYDVKDAATSSFQEECDRFLRFAIGAVHVAAGVEAPARMVTLSIVEESEGGERRINVALAHLVEALRDVTAGHASLEEKFPGTLAE